MIELVTIASFTNINMAQIAMLQLEAAGVEAVMIDSETVAMDWFLGRALGLIKVQVRAKDADRAARALDKADKESA
jgi:hypothetical protein